MNYEEKYKEMKKRVLAIGQGYVKEVDYSSPRSIAEYIDPDLKESENERIRNFLIDFIKVCGWTEKKGQGWPLREECIAWLENQGDTNKWKPSEDEMGALYGLAYLTNKMDDKKDEAITKLYQDLKREFFNGASYENMFPSSPVDAPIKDEKQGEQKLYMIQWKGNNLKEIVEFTGISPEFNNWFKSWDEFESYVHSHNDIFKLFFQDGSHYEVPKGAWIVRTPDGYNVASKSKFVEKQKPVEWSEEDEKKLQDVIYWFEIFCEKNQTKPEMKESLDWLKSLKPNHWKPSEEQMKAVFDASERNDKLGSVLRNLYDDLRKL